MYVFVSRRWESEPATKKNEKINGGKIEILNFIYFSYF